MDDQTEYVYQEPNYNLNDLPIAADNISTPAARDFVFSEDFLKFQVDTSLSLKNIFYLLQGLEYNEEKQKWLQSYDALLNDDGIHFVMQVMRSFIHKDINLSNLNEKQINDIVFFCCLSFRITRANRELVQIRAARRIQNAYGA